MKSQKKTKYEQDHEVECPHCGATEIVNDGTGTYKCSECGELIDLTLACPKCGEELEVEEWGESECPDCDVSFDSWKEAEVISDEIDFSPEEDEEEQDHEVECPHCGATEIVNDGTGTYKCSECGELIELTLACPNCGEELEVEEWGESECPDCDVSFDSWKEAEVISDEDKPLTTKPSLIEKMLNFLGFTRHNSEGNEVPGVNGFLGKYSLKQILGEGAFGQTFKAVDRLTNETVAVKVYKQTIGAEAFTELQKEVQSMLHVQHPHLVSYKDSNIIGSVYYLAMEFCQKGSLANIGKVRTTMAVQYIHQILTGIEWLHNNNLLHRDIKPDNILLDQTGKIKVGDFGLSISTEHTIIGIPAGTPLYMAPEQLVGGRTSCRSDIWSIGVVAYELLKGKCPFSSREAIIQCRKPRIAARDHGLAAVLAKALNPNEKQRFQTCSEFKKALEEIGLEDKEDQ